METKIYKPSAKVLKQANCRDWKKAQAAAAKNPVKFWEEAAKELVWHKPWKKAVECKPPFCKWFIGGKTNIVTNALDRHMGTPVEKKTAIIWENDEGQKRIITYRQLNDEVCRLANGLKSLGIKKSDRENRDCNK